MAKETWIQGQWQEVEACLRKNNDLTTEKQGKSTTIQDVGEVSQRRMKSLTGGQSTAQTFTTMRLMGTQ